MPLLPNQHLSLIFDVLYIQKSSNSSSNAWLKTTVFLTYFKQHIYKNNKEYPHEHLCLAIRTRHLDYPAVHPPLLHFLTQHS